MGCWGPGLYDSDEALDRHHDWLEGMEREISPVHLAVGVGVFVQCWPEWVALQARETQALIERHDAWLTVLPDEAARVLRSIASNPAGMTEGRSRPPRVAAVVGGYCDGPRYDALFDIPGAQQVIDSSARAMVDELGEREPGGDLYELSGELAALGLLLDLRVGIGPEKWTVF